MQLSGAGVPAELFVLIEQLMSQRFTIPDSGLSYVVVQYRPAGERTNLCVC
jgi:hypothetical protein